MASQPDRDTTPVETPFQGAQADCEKSEIAASDFDATLLFPSEAKATGGGSAHPIFFPDTYVRPLAPAFDPTGDTGTRKTRARSTERHPRDSVSTEAERLSALARVHAAQSAQLNEGYRQAARIEELLAWTEERLAKTTAQFERVAKMTDDLAPALARFEREAQALSESLANRVDQLIVTGSAVKQNEGDFLARQAPGISYRRWMSSALAALVANTPPRIAWRGARVLGGLGVLALVGGVLLRFPGEFDRFGTNEALLPARPLLNVSSPGPVWFGILAPGVVTVLDQSRRVADLEKPPVRTREFFGGLAVHSDPAGATVFVKGRPVGTTPLRLERLAAGTHAVRVEGVGYQPWTSAVLVPADKLTLVKASLHREVAAASSRRDSSVIVAGRDGR